ncbi:MAG: hypothetical protein WD077_08715 [Bacteroidia bacterium]
MGQLSIYNRCGETIWKGENEGWDGTVAHVGPIYYRTIPRQRNIRAG